MEDLLAKFYGKPESEGSSPVPVPSGPADPPEQSQPLEQRVSLIETQLLQMAKAQQAILSRLDTMIDQQPVQPAPQQEPPPAPRQVWRPAWKEPRPEPQPERQVPSSDDGTPLIWDPVNKMLHSLGDASDDEPSDKGHSAGKHMRTCTICGRQFPLHKGHMARSTQHGPETLHCPKCYSAHQAKRNTQIIGAVVIVVVIGFILLVVAVANVSSRSKTTNSPPRMELPTRPTPHTPHPRFPVPDRR
jgi:hypothetical protein